MGLSYPICPSAYFTSENTERISIKFGISTLHQTLLGQSDFGLYRPNKISISYEDLIEL
jgi:hypothetical protein